MHHLARPPTPSQSRPSSSDAPGGSGKAGLERGVWMTYLVLGILDIDIIVGECKRHLHSILIHVFLLWVPKSIYAKANGSGGPKRKGHEWAEVIAKCVKSSKSQSASVFQQGSFCTGTAYFKLKRFKPDLLDPRSGISKQVEDSLRKPYPTPSCGPKDHASRCLWHYIIAPWGCVKGRGLASLWDLYRSCGSRSFSGHFWAGHRLSFEPRAAREKPTKNPTDRDCDVVVMTIVCNRFKCQNQDRHTRRHPHGDTRRGPTDTHRDTDTQHTDTQTHTRTYTHRHTHTRTHTHAHGRLT